MAKIKIKDIEGDADEIKNLFKDMGCDLNSYLNTNPIKKEIHNAWVFIVGSLFFIVACLIWCDVFSYWSLRISILGLFSLLGVFVYLIHHKHEKWAITIIPIVTGLCLILISLNVYTPQELAKKLENKVENKIQNATN